MIEFCKTCNSIIKNGACTNKKCGKKLKIWSDKPDTRFGPDMETGHLMRKDIRR